MTITRPRITSIEAMRERTLATSAGAAAPASGPTALSIESPAVLAMRAYPLR